MKKGGASSNGVARGWGGLRTQAAATTLVLVAGILAATAWAHWNQFELAEDARDALAADGPQAAAAWDVAMRVARLRRCEAETAAAWDDPVARRAVLDDWREAEDRLRTDLARLADMQADPSERARTASWQQRGESYARSFENLVQEFGDSPQASGRELLAALQACRAPIDGLAEEVRSLASSKARQAEARGEDLLASIAHRVRLINGRAIVALLSVVLCAVWFFRRVLARIKVLGDAVRCFASGDFRVRLASLGHDELDQIARQWNEMAAKVRASHEQLDQARRREEIASRAKSEFLASVSEEIRVPVTVSLGYTEMLLGNLRNADNLEAASGVKRNIEYILQVIDDLRDLARIQTGQLRIEPLGCSPQRIVVEATSAARIHADVKGLSLEAEFDGPVPERVRTDPVRVRQILGNLLSNAVKFTELGTIRLVTRLVSTADGSRLQFEVVDTGVGMTPQQLAMLFKPLPADHGSSSAGLPATGLGLTLSKRLAEMLGGSLEADSTPGCGSTFTLTVPAGPLQGVRMVRPSGEAAEMAEPESSPAGSFDCRVLLADDGRENRRLLSFILKKAGADVEMAENGQQAVDRALAAMAATGAESEGRPPFDVILMDMQMPVLDGYDAARRLRQEGYPGPIVAITGHTRDYDRQRCLEAGCNDYLPKPVDRADLIAMVTKYTSRTAARA